MKSGGYAQFTINGKHRRAHRISYILANGPIPDGIFICHKCDNPKCVRASHLFAGDALSNMRDMIKKGRAVHPTGMDQFGERHSQARLNNEAVRHIRSAYKRGEAKPLAQLYGVSIACIRDVVYRRRWGHVT